MQATNNTIAALTQVAAAAGGPTNLCCLGAAYADILVALLEAKSPQVSMSVDVPPFAPGQDFSSHVNVVVALLPSQCCPVTVTCGARWKEDTVLLPSGQHSSEASLGMISSQSDSSSNLCNACLGRLQFTATATSLIAAIFSLDPKYSQLGYCFLTELAKDLPPNSCSPIQTAFGREFALVCFRCIELDPPCSSVRGPVAFPSCSMMVSSMHPRCMSVSSMYVDAAVPPRPASPALLQYGLGAVAC